MAQHRDKRLNILLSVPFHIQGYSRFENLTPAKMFEALLLPHYIYYRGDLLVMRVITQSLLHLWINKTSHQVAEGFP